MQRLKNTHIYQLDHINQLVVDSDNYSMFQSYRSLIAIYDKENRRLCLGRDYDYSSTTMRHLYQFILWYTSACDIKDALNNTSNKRKTLARLIKEGVIDYDSSMR